MIKFSYNPFNGHFIDCEYNNHSDGIYNAGQQKHFDNYIRGIIKDKVLYLRTYYPFNDIENLLIDDINKKSLQLLKEYVSILLIKIKAHYRFIPQKIEYNATQDLLKQKIGVYVI